MSDNDLIRRGDVPGIWDMIPLDTELKDAIPIMRQKLNGVDAQARPKGHWEFRTVDDGDYFFSRRWYCSECGDWQTYGETKFCPNCGADMRKEEHPEERSENDE